MGATGWLSIKLFCLNVGFLHWKDFKSIFFLRRVFFWSIILPVGSIFACLGAKSAIHHNTITPVWSHQGTDAGAVAWKRGVCGVCWSPVPISTPHTHTARLSPPARLSRSGLSPGTWEWRQKDRWRGSVHVENYMFDEFWLRENQWKGKQG